jgi:hypothetical protein
VDLETGIDLFRVHRDRLTDRDAYEFYAGLDAQGYAVWSPLIEERKPMFVDPRGVKWGMNAVYHPHSRRYLLAVTRPNEREWGIYDAPEPWGPWTTVSHGGFRDIGMKTVVLPRKWMSADGTQMWMIFSGNSRDDAFNVVGGEVDYAFPSIINNKPLLAERRRIDR